MENAPNVYPPAVNHGLHFWQGILVATDLDWCSQLKHCQSRIAELNDKIASEKLKIQRLFDQRLAATAAQRRLAIREESLARLQSSKTMIESRIADRAAYELAASHIFLDRQRRALPRWGQDSADHRAVLSQIADRRRTTESSKPNAFSRG